MSEVAWLPLIRTIYTPHRFLARSFSPVPAFSTPGCTVSRNRCYDTGSGSTGDQPGVVLGEPRPERAVRGASGALQALPRTGCWRPDRQCSGLTNPRQSREPEVGISPKNGFRLCSQSKKISHKKCGALKAPHFLVQPIRV